MKNSEITFVVQGAFSEITYNVINSIKKYFVGAKIIISCWESCKVEIDDEIMVVRNIDPCSDIIYNVNDEAIFNENTSRQIVTTLGGLLNVETEYAVKIRSDMVFESSEFILVYEKLVMNKTCKIFEFPVLISSINTINPFSSISYTHHYSDWFFFGKTADLLKIWLKSEKCINNITGKINIKDDWESQNFPFTDYTAEQRIFVNLLKEHYGSYNYNEVNHRLLSIHFVANELIIMSPKQIGFVIDKYKYLIKFNYKNFKQARAYIGFSLNVISYSDWLFLRNLNIKKISFFKGIIFLTKIFLSNNLMNRNRRN